MTEFCKARGVERDLVCFLYNGQEVFETDTKKETILTVLTGNLVLI